MRSVSIKETRASKGLWFSITIGGDEFVALLSGEALQDRFHASTIDSQRDVYRKHRLHIESVARRKFETGFPRPIKLVPADFDDTGFYDPVLQAQ